MCTAAVVGLLRKITFVASLFLGVAQAYADVTLVPYKATYEATVRGSTFAGVQQIKHVEDNKFEYSFKASGSAAKINESTTFILKDNQVRPLSYKNDQKIVLFKRQVSAMFDWQNKTVEAKYKGKTKSLPIENENLHSRLSYQLQIQLDAGKPADVLDYYVVSKHKISHYIFDRLADEVITTPLGEFNAIVVSRRYDQGSDKLTRIWLARDFNNIILKLDQSVGEESTTLLISSANLDGKAVKGN